MKIFLSIYLVLQTIFNGWSQTDSISFVHNGYEFQTDVKTIINYLEIEADSISLYTIKLREISENNPKIDSGSKIELGEFEITIYTLLGILDENHSLVKIKRVSDNQLVKYKVKYLKKEDLTKGLGGSSKTYIILIDKKKKVEILREIIKFNLAC